MTVFRVIHNKNYTTINNFITKDNRLSWKAKGIWLYAFSRPDDWTFHLNDIINQSTDGRDSVRAGLKELEECGYLRRNLQKRENGKFAEPDWIFYELPTVEKRSKSADLPFTENPLTENPISENPPLLSTEYIPVVVEEYPPGIKKTTTLKPKPMEKKPMTKDDVYFYNVKAKKGWTPNEIDNAWDRFKSSTSLITDPMQYISGIIAKMRLQEQNKQTKQNQKDKSCSPKTNQSKMASIKQAQKDRYDLANPSDPSKKKSSELVMLMPSYAKSAVQSISKN